VRPLLASLAHVCGVGVHGKAWTRMRDNAQHDSRPPLYDRRQKLETHKGRKFLLPRQLSPALLHREDDRSCRSWSSSTWAAIGDVFHQTELPSFLPSRNSVYNGFAEFLVLKFATSMQASTANFLNFLALQLPVRFSSTYSTLTRFSFCLISLLPADMDEVMKLILSTPST